MYTTPIQIQDSTGQPILNSRGLIWGHNAAWLCVECDDLLGNRTAKSEHLVNCYCGEACYEILRAPNNKNGRLHMGLATGPAIAG
jgi:hypothetical protein